MRSAWRYTVNENYFNSWSPNMAWILGFITADGCLYKGNRKHNTPSLSFTLAIKDVEILEFIKKELIPDGRILYYNAKSRTGLHKACRLVINNSSIYNSLLKLGITPRKSCNEKVISIPLQYHRDYLRGLFDGDGYVGYYIVNKSFIKKFSIISGNFNFLQQIKTEFGLDLGNIVLSNKKYYRWNVYDIKSLQQIYNYMYSSNGFYLKRKKQSFQEMFKYWEIRHAA